MKDKLIIKINIPLTEQDFITGNGEGIFAEIHIADYVKMENSPCTHFWATALNDSVYYPNLKYGCTFEAMSRGENRPVAFRTKLINSFGQPISIEEKDIILRKIYEQRRGIF